MQSKIEEFKNKIIENLKNFRVDTSSVETVLSSQREFNSLVKRLEIIEYASKEL